MVVSHNPKACENVILVLGYQFWWKHFRTVHDKLKSGYKYVYIDIHLNYMFPASFPLTTMDPEYKASTICGFSRLLSCCTKVMLQAQQESFRSRAVFGWLDSKQSHSQAPDIGSPGTITCLCICILQDAISNTLQSPSVQPLLRFCSNLAKAGSVQMTWCEDWQGTFCWTWSVVRQKT